MKMYGTAITILLASLMLTACGGSHSVDSNSNSAPPPPAPPPAPPPPPPPGSNPTYDPVPATACGSATISATALSSDIRFIDPVNVSSAGGLSEHPSIATGVNGKVYVAWDDDKELNKDIFLRVSQDYGSTYGEYLNVSNTGSATVASIGVDGDETIYAVWQDVSVGPSEIFYARKKESESVFFTAVQISEVNASDDTSTQSLSVALAVAPRSAAQGADNVYAAWSDSSQKTQTYPIHLARSTDGGDSFPTVFTYTPLANGTASTVALHVDAGGNVHMVWAEAALGGERKIKYAKSMDQGISFSTPVVLATGLTLRSPTITSAPNNSSNVYVAWTDEDIFRISFSASHDGGQSFSVATAVFDTDITSKELSVRLDSGSDGTIYASWTDNRTGNYETMFAKSADNGVTFTAPVVFSPNAQGSLFTAISVDDEGNVYIGADDNRYVNPPDTLEEIGNEGNFEILVARGKQGLPAVQGASASPCPITPNGDNDADSTTFSGQFSEPLNWTLTVFAPDGTTVVHQNTGTGIAMTDTWDGKSGDAVVADGLYTYTLSGSNSAGIASTGASGSLVTYVATEETPPEITIFSREAFGFSPNSDGFKDSDGITAEFNKPVNWTIEIEDGEKVVKRTFKGSGANIDANTVRWDGKDEDGNVLPEANYTLLLSVIDGLGQTDSCGVLPFPCLNMEIDTTKPFINNLQLSAATFNPLAGSLKVAGVPEETALVTIYVYNQVDVLVRKVDRTFRNAGEAFEVSWDGLNTNNQPATPGNYVVKVWCRDRSGNTAPTYPYELSFKVELP